MDYDPRKKLKLENSRIDYFEKLTIPEILKGEIPITDTVKNNVKEYREIISNILQGKDKRLIMIVGPCSIHNIDEAKIYGNMLKQLSNQVEDKIFIIMRVYFEKPRTTNGWKGLINDPDLDESFQVNKGIRLARDLLLYLNKIGLPCAYEILDTITPQYISDLISWGAIGARTTESQVHRQIVSGLSMPVGFKNGTGGSIDIALDGIVSSKNPHCFMGITNLGEPSVCRTKGNPDTHIILRGGKDGPNYYEKNLDKLEEDIEVRSLNIGYIVDCSHGNSRKDYLNQPKVLDYLIKQRTSGRNKLVGIMLESNINEGKQNLNKKGELKYGVSITDSCLSFQQTEQIIVKAYQELD
jgi:3-deoxy-7-phosphoheptulonate synthase